MAKRKGERNPPRFTIGEMVEIGTTIFTRHRELTGRIVEVEISQHCHTLDRYLVQFTVAAEPRRFWDIQLEKVSDLNRRLTDK
jgi:hypothetical protein